MYFRNTCFKVGMYYWLAHRHEVRFYRMAIMQVDMYYWKACGSCGLVFYENICCSRTCLIGGHVLQVCAKAAIIQAAVSLGNWCVYFFRATFICSGTCFQKI